MVNKVCMRPLAYSCRSSILAIHSTNLGRQFGLTVPLKYFVRSLVPTIPLSMQVLGSILFKFGARVRSSLSLLSFAGVYRLKSFSSVLFFLSVPLNARAGVRSRARAERAARQDDRGEPRLLFRHILRAQARSPSSERAPQYQDTSRGKT